ncbi:hypothetical protein ART_2357 [Arthrobacter sp. PAMC 25486]|uniref:hypothetical protein n=1 Tax=Arthrobacter sp. PAMC 25486 TaxID=1494608 RepID=UPI000535FDF0|nr:hypothetical protein [Arthrobacter sp. PAMC 25486]AIY01956.1 hypothetical protein ART_2357 [Arthrobacter sp. PAMC 25486]
MIGSKASTRSNDQMGRRLASTLIAVSLGEGDFITRLHEPFPWMTFFSNEPQRKFADEVVEVARGCAFVGHFGRLSITISAWEASATALAEGFRSNGSDLQYLDEPIIVQ